MKHLWMCRYCDVEVTSENMPVHVCIVKGKKVRMTTKRVLGFNRKK